MEKKKQQKQVNPSDCLAYIRYTDYYYTISRVKLFNKKSSTAKSIWDIECDFYLLPVNKITFVWIFKNVSC